MQKRMKEMGKKLRDIVFLSAEYDVMQYKNKH
jgi:hypothetical protein